MSGYLGTSGKPLKVHTDQYRLETRTTDISNPVPGEMWLRTDLNSGDRVSTLKWYDGSATNEIPVFAMGTSGADVEEVLRVQTPNGVGYIPTTSTSPAYSELALQHGGSQLGWHDAIETSAIPDSAISQYDTTALTGYSNDDVVDPFTDQRGSNDATATGNPLFKTNVQNGNPVVRYDGTDDYHDTGYVVDTTGPHSAIVVAQLTGDLSTTWALYSSVDVNLDDRISIGTNPNDSSWRIQYGDSLNSAGTLDTDPHIFSMTAGGGSAELYIDGSLTVSLNYTGQGTTSGSMFIGARNRPDSSIGTYWGGDVAELRNYAGDLDDSTRSSIEQDLADKWGITL